jgi:hypothetical protein
MELSWKEPGESYMPGLWKQGCYQNQQEKEQTIGGFLIAIAAYQ